ncbi:hypothetical protein MF271_20475 (plasmid) [Deinococcus sp. KNUC1210]|uniref:hypothetical protein n=1 Tax=Deinococcus sp. KNUC1210 TaxID=2917691 RepID=UPI001EF0FB6D|nr:hypothetical protein [Deinococcus sp. KNUC1210]ULH17780.1 hypothetical protein MF271_20475 [Deinococcus sp. KNUC1210]
MTHRPPPPTDGGFREKLRRTLHLRTGEGRLVAALGSLLLVNSFAIQLSYVASVSGLLENGQVVGLPTVWLLSYLLTLGLTSVQLRLIDRYDKRRLLVGVSMVFALLLYAVWWGLNLHLPSVLTYGLLYVIADQQWLIFPLVFWAMCSDVMGMAQAKRLFPIIASVGFVGKILGLTLAWVAPLVASRLNLHLPGLLLLGFVMYVLAAILSVRLSGQEAAHVQVGGRSPRPGSGLPEPSAKPAIREHASPFLRLFAEHHRNHRQGSAVLRRRWTPGQWNFSAWLRARSGAIVIDLNTAAPKAAPPAPGLPETGTPRLNPEPPAAVSSPMDASSSPAPTPAPSSASSPEQTTSPAFPRVQRLPQMPSPASSTPPAADPPWAVKAALPGVDRAAPGASPWATPGVVAARRQKAGSAPGPDSSPRRPSTPPARDALGTGWQFIQDVPIFKYQALSVFVLAACETILEFVFLYRLEYAFSQADQYQSFYSGYRFLTTLLGFALQALVTGRVIERLTLRNALSVTAVVLSGVCGLLLLLPGILSSSLGMGVTRVVRDTIDESSQKSLQAVIPSDKRGRVSLLIDSYILSLGTVTSCLLLLAVWHFAPNWSAEVRLAILMVAALLLACVGVWSVLRLRQVYDSSLLNWRLRRRQRGGDVLERLEF